jgi:hypothetical protein
MVVAKVFTGQARLPSNEDMRTEYNERLRARGYGKPFHSLRNMEAEYVNELLNWINSDLQISGRSTLLGHTDKWHKAREEQLERIKALFAAPSPARDFQITCQ